MATEPTSSYPTLRRTRAALRVLAPIASATALLTGLTMFAGVAPKLVGVGYGSYERLIWGAIGLGYLIGAPILAFVLFFLLRAGADLIDLWIDQGVSAEKTADLVERQLVPGVLRMCQLLEKTSEALTASQAGQSAAPVPAPRESLTPAIEAIRESIRREMWDQARRQAAALVEQFPEAVEAKGMATHVEAVFDRNIQNLRQSLDEAERTKRTEAMLDFRDRLSGYVTGGELQQLDRRVARAVAAQLREALANGRARDVVHLAERVVDTFGDSTSEGAQVRAALPTLRRSAGLCPECGEPYDVSMVRCQACEAKRTTKRKAAAKPGSS